MNPKKYIYIGGLEDTSHKNELIKNNIYTIFWDNPYMVYRVMESRRSLKEGNLDAFFITLEKHRQSQIEKILKS